MNLITTLVALFYYWIWSVLHSAFFDFQAPMLVAVGVFIVCFAYADYCQREVEEIERKSNDYDDPAF